MGMGMGMRMYMAMTRKEVCSGGQNVYIPAKMNKRIWMSYASSNGWNQYRVSRRFRGLYRDKFLYVTLRIEVISFNANGRGVEGVR